MHTLKSYEELKTAINNLPDKTSRDHILEKLEEYYTCEVPLFPPDNGYRIFDNLADMKERIAEPVDPMRGGFDLGLSEDDKPVSTVKVVPTEACNRQLNAASNVTIEHPDGPFSLFNDDLKNIYAVMVKAF